MEHGHYMFHRLIVAEVINWLIDSCTIFIIMKMNQYFYAPEGKALIIVPILTFPLKEMLIINGGYFDSGINRSCRKSWPPCVSNWGP